MTTFTAHTPAAAPAASGIVPGPEEVRMPAHRRPGHTIVGLSGVLDGAAAPALREHLIGALRRSGRLLILDLSEVASADAAGLAVLIGIRRRAAGLGITLRLAAPVPQVAERLRAMGLDRALTVRPATGDRAGIAA
ncbi:MULTISPECIES: STAS domain-containing protein [Actinomadura]|uniref:STAS domain-containing protein n=1 Tax=Actinomadura yumaensis TaxID=111807 RepID=A0ABW2CD53_9ACTN|nr:STAS domain-containing protein [Actinomadura sp. J1-007]MWK35607.1 STAS domain-containing protein [Actinomadura sp. J1-007]